MESNTESTHKEQNRTEDFLESVINTVIDGIILINQQGQIVRVNPSALNYFGYTEDEVVGRNVSILMGSPHAQAHDSYIGNYLRTGVGKIISVGREVEGIRKDGTSFPFRLAVSKFEYQNQFYFTGIIHDLTAQKKAENQMKRYAEDLESEVKNRTLSLEVANKKLESEIHQKNLSDEALKESQKLYKLIAQNFPNGTINVFDKELNYIFVEGKGLMDLGIQTEDLIGSNFIDRIDSQIRDTVKERLTGVFHGQPTTFDLKNRQNVHLLRAEPLFTSRGTIEQILVVETNITKRKKAEDDMAKALAKEVELNVLKSRFVSMASHEFRTPLSVILSSATLLSKYKETEQQPKREKHVNRIKSNVENLNLILEDFLSLEKLNAGKLTMKPSKIELVEYTQDCIEETEGILKKGQTVRFDPNREKHQVYLDRNMYKNILVNLLSNASKYSGPEAPIDVNLKITSTSVELGVRDHGIGIPKSEQANLFSRFFRASNAGNIQGTGLGLHIVKSYVDLIGGSIRCESQLDVGTHMKIKINLVKRTNEENSGN